MLRRLFVMGLLGALPVLGCGCPCCVLVAGQARGAEVAALGADTRVPTAEEARTYQLGKLVGKVQGQYVSGVEKSGPAEKAGLNAGDVLLVLDANKVFSRDDVEDFLRVSQPGAQVKVLVKRSGPTRRRR